ncbi:MAG: Do family serine endopeptidase [Bacteroidia bacterium]
MFKNFVKFIAFFLIAMLGGISGVFIYQKLNPQSSSSTEVISATQKPTLVNYPLVNPEATLDFTQAAAATINGVVHVKTSYGTSSKSNDPFKEYFGNPYRGRQGGGSGSGVIISENGYIVTNNHVVDNAQNIEVVLNDNRTYNAKVIGTDPSTDLALIKVEEKNLPFIYYGNSDEVSIGEWVLAVGNPFNLTSTVTAGIVSAKARNIGILPDQFAIESFIQTDAAVNPGNSGGALVNTHGELVGINTAIASQTGTYSGYSFAVPVNLVKKVVDDLVEFGTVQRAFLGVSIRSIDSKLASDLNLPTMSGVYVAGTTDDGAANAAGIMEGDIITKVNGVTVFTSPQLQEQVARYRPGDKIKVNVLRSGKDREMALVLRNKEGTTAVIKPSIETIDVLGASFEAVSTEERSKLGVENGVKVTKLNRGKLFEVGIKEGFIITSIDKVAVKSPEDVSRALQNKQGGVLLEGVYPNGMRATYGFGI